MRDAVGTVQSVLVLGGTSDIGLAIARRLAAPRSARVLLAGRDTAAMRGAYEGAEVLAFDADDTASHAAFADRAFAQDIDVVVLAVGVLGDQAKAEADPAAAVDVLQTNLVGCASIALHVANKLREQGHGTLVVLSSVAGERVRRSNFVYGASKAGLDGLAQGLGDSLVGSGASVLVVRPGFVESKMTAGMKKVPFSTTPEKVAEAVDRAVRSGGELIWVPGILRLVMSVLRHLPRQVFRKMPV
ncbi:MAG: decaprenylphospho-beta-D-erythro-pentofuranosid-2-ulose 2-reductase [Actinobacteria bacterium]|nr:decaprenylphospho-beta-D-erythro-pentofuranosid-2-ulose 2-reductase [Actinomycetota bacterium]MCA1719782.1 decaprenylphospho-beta-D-erythro-pentofuranosid-2-ulose 2-reductase [Actinomycetota bacterium]